MTEQVVFQSETRTADGYGGFTSAWTTSVSAAAAVFPVYVNERDDRGAVRNMTQYRFVVYANAAISEAMRIQWAGRTLNIDGIKHGMGRDLFVEIIATDGVTD